MGGREGGSSDASPNADTPPQTTTSTLPHTPSPGDKGDHTTALKLIDFGLASYWAPGDVMRDVVGTPLYIAPEVLRGSYGVEARGEGGAAGGE